MRSVHASKSFKALLLGLVGALCVVAGTASAQDSSAVPPRNTLSAWIWRISIVLVLTVELVLDMLWVARELDAP